ncbi:hypothetical protein NHH73_18070 [Oxalobacteraceae bacterium OTU3CINTB1]|nr:hypothetical protein NHH73_18070 [Oxalobacteraceae bacterium OTU3CINTB1]
MRLVLRACTAALFFFPLLGCNSLYSGYSVTPIEVTKDSPYAKLTQQLRKSTANDDRLIDAACFGSAIPEGEIPKCTSQRNMAIATLVIASEEACLRHRRSMYGNEATWNIGFGTLTNLFAGAASVVSAEHTKSILAALALFSNSERSLVNETVYKQMLVTAVDKKIVEMRDEKMRSIYILLKKDDVSAYSIHEALRDLIVLHNKCSFIDGLEKALHEGTQDTSTVKMARLRSNLLLLRSERSLVKEGESTHTTGLDERIRAVNAALQAEEVR